MGTETQITTSLSLGGALCLNHPKDEIDIYMSTSGDDSNDGLTEGTPKLTQNELEAILTDSKRVGFKKGDEWYGEQLDVTESNVELKSYGTGNLPVLSGMTNQSSGWALTGAANSYSKAITHTAENQAGYNFLMVARVNKADYLAGKPSAFYYLQRATSAANCEATQNSWYYPNLTSPTTVTIHVANEDDVTINPADHGTYDIYVVTVNFALEAYSSNGIIVKDKHFRGSADGYGIGLGKDFLFEGNYSEGGGTHHIVGKDGIIRGCVFGQQAYLPPYGPITVVFYEASGTGNTGLIEDSIFFVENAAAVYSHNSNGHTEPYEYLTVQNSWFYGNQTNNGVGAGENKHLTIKTSFFRKIRTVMGGSAAQNITIENNYVDECDSFLSIATPGLPHDQQLIIRNNNVLCNAVADDANRKVFTLNQTGDKITLENNNFYCKSRFNESQTIAYTLLSNSLGMEIVFNKNIVICELEAGKRMRVVSGDGNNKQWYIGDNNVYILISATAGAGITWNNINPSNSSASFDNWKTYSEQDTNSLFFDYQTSGETLDNIFVNPTFGTDADWRLRTDTADAQAIAALGAGCTSLPGTIPSTPTYDSAKTKLENGDLKTETIYG